MLAAGERALGTAIEHHLELIGDPELEREERDVRAAVAVNAAVLLSLRADATGTLDDYRSAITLAEQAARLAEPGSVAYLLATQSQGPGELTRQERGPRGNW
ncbi:hypothetical protein [Nonomuraea aurantiaca]|uniref:hypothetical protein n=1 Tax=Nonomuraea aurantiaca TaxID=2878562 RepID=UPI001CD9A865|nr:hypothetical protein [Nonomuraea aurantiaca]MCA2225160.1 hypothetical protein [Nonomuraea aurantiaca]